MSVFVHQTAVVEPGAQLGEGSKVWHFVHVCPTAKIGKRCVLGQGVFVADNVVLGDNVHVQNHVSIYDGVVLEDDVFCGPSMVFTNVKNPRSAVPRKSNYEQTLVRKGVTIGANATIVCGVELGEFAFVGAGSVVTRDVAPHSLVVGNPARHVGWACICGERIGSVEPDGTSLSCECGRGYTLQDQTLIHRSTQ